MNNAQEFPRFQWKIMENYGKIRWPNIRGFQGKLFQSLLMPIKTFVEKYIYILGV